MKNKSGSEIVKELTKIGNGSMNKGFAELLVSYKNMPKVVQENKGLKLGLGLAMSILVASIIDNHNKKKQIMELEDNEIRNKVSEMSDEEILEIVNEAAKEYQDNKEEEEDINA